MSQESRKKAEAMNTTDHGAPHPLGTASTDRSPTRRHMPTLGKVTAWVVMVVILMITLLPFYWILRSALSTNPGLLSDSGALTPPEFTTGAFERVLGMQSTEQALAEGGSGAELNFWRYLLNSVLVATLVTVCQVLFSAMAAYAFSRLHWPGRDKVFALFLAGLMVPTVFTLLPNFVFIKQLGLIDTVVGIALPTMFMTPFAVFFLRQFFLGIPVEIEEAARLDGTSRIGTFFKVILPMAASPMATLSILTYITAWNDYLWPLMVSYTESSQVLTVALGVFRTQSPQSGTDWAGLMAASLIAALPMFLLFLAFAKRIVNSIGFSGIK